MNYLTNEVDRMISYRRLTMILIYIVTILLLNLANDGNKFEFALFELTGG